MRSFVAIIFQFLMVGAALLDAGVPGLTTIYQPLTTAETDQELVVIVAPVPVIAGGASEELLTMIAQPNKLLQSDKGAVADSNLLSRLGIRLRASLGEGASYYVVLLDFAGSGAPERFGVTLNQVLAATVEAIQRTIENTRLYHPPAEEVRWRLRLEPREKIPADLRRLEKEYVIAPRRIATPRPRAASAAKNIKSKTTSETHE
jgi:hypothetical protein